MARVSKKARRIAERLTEARLYSLTEALTLCQEFASPNFDESVDVAVNLGVDVRKSDQIVRGAVLLPGGSGRQVRVAVFAEGAQAVSAREAGADVVGHQDLAREMQSGAIDYDVVIATPEAMPLLSKLGRILGPKGLMPNPRLGTVSEDVAQAVHRARSGQVRYRTDKNGIVHCPVGKLSFKVSVLEDNIHALLAELRRNKPGTSKGVYLRKMSISSTMGPGFPVDLGSLAL